MAPNTSATFRITLPILNNINFCRGLVGKENLKIKIKFVGS
jgi:hypothetical protein